MWLDKQIESVCFVDSQYRMGILTQEAALEFSCSVIRVSGFVWGDAAAACTCRRPIWVLISPEHAQNILLGENGGVRVYTSHMPCIFKRTMYKCNLFRIIYALKQIVPICSTKNPLCLLVCIVQWVWCASSHVFQSASSFNKPPTSRAKNWPMECHVHHATTDRKSVV